MAGKRASHGKDSAITPVRRAAFMVREQLQHAIGLAIHLLLGFANISFWQSFQQQHLFAVGIVTTTMHAALAATQAACLWWGRPRDAGVVRTATP